MVLTGLPSILIVESYTEERLYQSAQNELRRVAAVAFEALPSVLPRDMPLREQSLVLDKIADKIGQATDSRITLVDEKGNVLGDSIIDGLKLSTIENHSARPEISKAKESGFGSSKRYSSTAGADVMYVAINANHNPNFNNIGDYKSKIIIRSSRPLKSVNETLSGLHANLIFIGAAVLIIATFLGYLGSIFLSKVIQSERDGLEKKVSSRTKEISLLQTFGGLLNACSNMEEASQVMRNVIPQLLPDMKGGVSIIKNSRNRLDLIATWGGDFQGTERFSPSDCWALRKGHQHLSSEHGMRVSCNHWREKEMDTLCIPLLAQGETIGVLHFEVNGQQPISYVHQIWDAIAEQIGLTLANIQLRQNLREQAIRDPLTTLYNRRFLTEALDKSFARAERNKSSVAVMMLDADHFKRFNDNFGHDAGDHVLKAISQEIKESVRQEDIASRFGGEEFCLVCPELSADEAENVANRIRTRISALELSMNQLTLGTVTISIGVAVYPEKAKSPDELIKAADEALYIAKENGRNQVVVFGAQVKSLEDKSSEQIIKKTG